MQTKPVTKPPQSSQKEKGEKKLKKRTLIAAVFILVVVPAALFAGSQWLKDFDFSLFGATLSIRSYYFISLFMIICTMIPFFMVFEKRKPQARELIIIAMLSAIAVAGRAAFFMLPQFKPMMAIVIIAGVCFGAESGFLVGAVSAFVSNFFFGQGPWTPWQMFAMGLCGFLAGVLYRRGLLRRGRVSLCIYGALSALLIYGVLMNVSSALLWQSPVSWATIGAYLLSGFPVDCVHAAATVCFLWLFGEPMLEKLDRIKVKYGLLA